MAITTGQRNTANALTALLRAQTKERRAYHAKRLGFAVEQLWREQEPPLPEWARAAIKAGFKPPADWKP